jgi:hypothetical protein
MSFAPLRNPAVYHRDLRSLKRIAGEFVALRLWSAFICIFSVLSSRSNRKEMHI